MAGNLSRIVAGQAFVTYRVADQEKFDKDNQRAEQSYRKSTERMERMWDSYVKHRFDAERKYQQWQERQQQKQERDEARRLARMKREREQALRDVSLYGSIGGYMMQSAGMRIGGAVMDSVRQYGTVEAYLLNIRESVRDNTNDIIGDMQRLEKAAYKLGETTEYDAAHIASGFDVLAVQNAAPNQMLGVMGSIVNLASVFSNERFGKVMPDQAATTVTETMRAWDMGFGDIPMIVDKLAVAGRQGNISLQELGDAMRYAGGSAQEAGVSFDETLALLVELDRRGQKGEMGGTAIRGIMASLLDPSKEGREAMEAFGIQMPQTGKLSLFDMLGQFDDKLGGLSEVERAQVIAKAFPNRQMSGVQMLIGASSQLQEMRGKFANSEGQGAKLASAKREGVNFILDVFDSALQTLKAEFGESLKTEITAIFRGLAHAVGWMAETLDAHPNIGKMIGLIAAGLVTLGTTVGGLFTGLGLLAGIQRFAQSLQILGWVTPAVTRIGAALTGPVGMTVAIASLAMFLDQTFTGGKIFRPIYDAVKRLWNWMTQSDPSTWKNAETGLRTEVRDRETGQLLTGDELPSIRLGRSGKPAFQETELQKELRRVAQEGMDQRAAAAKAGGADTETKLQKLRRSRNSQREAAMNRVGDLELRTEQGSSFVMSLLQKRDGDVQQQLLLETKKQTGKMDAIQDNTKSLKKLADTNPILVGGK